MKKFFDLLSDKNALQKTGGQTLRLNVDELESREVPSAWFGAPPMGHGFFDGLGGLLAQTSTTTSTTTTTLTASLTGSTGTSGSITFTTNSSTGTNSLSVTVSGLTASATYTVLAGTTPLGAITTNASGKGELVVSNETATLASGTAITVTDSSGTTVLSGSLASPTTSTSGGMPGGCGGQQQSRGDLTATLSGSTGSGKAKVEINAATGTNKIEISITGLADSTTYTVMAGTTSLGPITMNSSGNGNLFVKNTTAALTAGTTITVVDSSNNTVLSGTLAYPVNPITQLTGSLTGASGTSATGAINYVSNSKTDTNSLAVHLSGLADNTTYTVMSGTTTLGTITTNSKGWGFLFESNIATPLTSGATITVVNAGTTALTGTLGAPTNSGHDHGFGFDGFFGHSGFGWF